jgi:aspartokinase-like uncharacterized kinase
MTGRKRLVIKVGGSLFDLPDLGERLSQLLDLAGNAETVLVPGGGAFVDVIRDLDGVHHLGQESAHQLALAAMVVSGHFLTKILANRSSELAVDLPGFQKLWDLGKLPVVNAVAFGAMDDASTEPLQHHWDVTSDSIAARLAIYCGADELWLLKSKGVPADRDVEAAACGELVDPTFPDIIRAQKFALRIINLRHWPMEEAARLGLTAPRARNR